MVILLTVVVLMLSCSELELDAWLLVVVLLAAVVLVAVSDGEGVFGEATSLIGKIAIYPDSASMPDMLPTTNWQSLFGRMVAAMQPSKS